MSAIGIDLGTTYCCVGVWNNDGVEIIVNEQGNRITASCVAFTDTERIIGDSARNQSTINAANTVFDVKRLLGQRFNGNLEKCMKHWSFKIVKKNYRPQVCVLYQGEKKVISPEEITAMILMKIKENVETYLGETVNNVVISVPACFNDSQRQSIKNASLIAGLQVLRIINEPTAAAMAYAFDKNIREERCILIYDLGGGSFDVSVITIDEGSLFEVKSCGGITHLGGEDFDNRLVEYLADEFYNKYNVNIRDNCKALRRLKVAAETAKRILSSSTEVSIEMDGLYDGLDFNTKLYRSKFEELCDDLFKSTLDVVEKVLNDAKVKKSNINDIILIGGSTRIPKIQQMLQDYFSGKQLNFSLNPDEAVAYGAATFAAVLLGRISPTVRDVLLVDIISFDIEIETLNGIRTVIVEHNTRLPYKYSQYFTTYKDNQTAVTLRLYESKKFQFAGGGCVENLLGQFTISGIQPAARGIPQIEVTFDVDTNGILNVSARENSTGQPKTMVVDEMQWKLSEEMINQMILDAQVYKVKDDIQREKVKARNLLESHIFSAKQAVDEAGDTLTDTEKDSRIKQCDNMLQWLDNYSKIEKDEFDSKMKTLQNICYPITFKINNSSETENRTSSH